MEASPAMLQRPRRRGGNGLPRGMPRQPPPEAARFSVPALQLDPAGWSPGAPPGSSSPAQPSGSGSGRGVSARVHVEPSITLKRGPGTRVLSARGASQDSATLARMNGANPTRASGIPPAEGPELRPAASAEPGAGRSGTEATVGRALGAGGAAASSPCAARADAFFSRDQRDRKGTSLTRCPPPAAAPLPFEGGAACGAYFGLGLVVFRDPGRGPLREVGPGRDALDALVRVHPAGGPRCTRA